MLVMCWQCLCGVWVVLLLCVGDVFAMFRCAMFWRRVGDVLVVSCLCFGDVLVIMLAMYSKVFSNACVMC